MGILSFIKPKNKEEKNAAQTPVNAIQMREAEAVQRFAKGLIDIKDIIAPSAIEVNFNNLVIGNKFFRSYFAIGYPSVVVPNWLEPLINFEYPIDISTFYYPNETGDILKVLKRKVAEMQATLNIQVESGQQPDPVTKQQLQDALTLQEQLAAGNEKFFQYALYLTIHADSLEELEKVSKNLEATMATLGVIVKVATLQQEECFQSTIPYGVDKINMLRNLDTTAIATTFPFVSSELTMEKGVLYGINLHNSSLVIFDRYSLPNANGVVLASSGAGKSYAVKLEAVRSLMLGVDIIIIDPEKEFDRLCKAVGGEYISFSQDGAQKLNPFELSGIYQKDEDELRFKILTLAGLVRMMLGGTVTSEESAILDRALILTYKEKGISPDPSTHHNEPPLLEDLFKILNAMSEDEAHSMARRLEKFIRGSASGVFDRKSTVDIHNTFTVFSIRDLADDLRPLAMYVMLDYIWTKIKRDKRKRMLIIDEAWIMMQYEDAARFVYSIAKRARKYALGLTTITQDVDDFLTSDFGKAIVNNAAMQILLKQSPSAIDKLQKVFYLTEGEKQFLMSAGIGQGIFFAGANHVAIQIVASENEHNLITTNPNDIIANKINSESGDALDLGNTQMPDSAQQTYAESSNTPQPELSSGTASTPSQNQLPEIPSTEVPKAAEIPTVSQSSTQLQSQTPSQSNTTEAQSVQPQA
jgi:conjugal transfer ATP-binding protein TraC